MSEALPLICLALYGDTAWTVSGQHASRTGFLFNPDGERNGQRLGERMKNMIFAKPFTGRLKLAAWTCKLAGFRNSAATNLCATSIWE